MSEKIDLKKSKMYIIKIRQKHTEHLKIGSKSDPKSVPLPERQITPESLKNQCFFIDFHKHVFACEREAREHMSEYKHVLEII